MTAQVGELANNIFCHHVRVGLVGGQINFELFLFRPDSLEHWNNLAGTTLGFKRAPRGNLSTIPLCNNIPRNTPYRAAYVHEKMGTNGPIAKT